MLAAFPLTAFPLAAAGLITPIAPPPTPIPTLTPNGSDTIDGAASLAMTGANWRVLHSGAP